jgi:hypothetical protein
LDIGVRPNSVRYFRLFDLSGAGEETPDVGSLLIISFFLFLEINAMV